MTGSSDAVPPPGAPWTPASSGPGRCLRAGDALAAIVPRNNPAEDNVQAAEAEGHQNIEPRGGRDGGDGAEGQKRNAHHGNHADGKRPRAGHARAVEQQPDGGKEMDEAG